jgi:hypothetical protein
MADRWSRREMLRRAPTCLALALLATATALRGAHAQQKVSKQMVQYQASPKGGHQCSGCSNFLAPSSCKVVAGTISPHGWCSIWTPK